MIKISQLFYLLPILTLLTGCQAAPMQTATPTILPEASSTAPPFAVEAAYVTPDSITIVATPEPPPNQVGCWLLANQYLEVYTRPNQAADIFGTLSAGEWVEINAITVDGWLGLDPGVAQAANIGPFRLRWVQKSQETILAGQCNDLPEVDNLPAGVCFQMFMQETKILEMPEQNARSITTVSYNDYAQVLGYAGDWLEVDLSTGNLKLDIKGWISSDLANLNGPCSPEELPTVVP